MKTKAFTLIETLLYLALFNVIFFAVITFTISLSQNNHMAEYKNAIEKNAIFMTEHIQDTFLKAQGIDSANSTFDNANGKVRVTLATGYLEYSLSNGVLMVYNGTTSSPLTDKFVTVNNFTVSPVKNAASTIIGARITLTLTAIKYPTLTKTVQSYYAFR